MSLPSAQQLLERHAKDERIAVVAVATAFEKDKYPEMADETKIREALVGAKLTLPVMRDLDEKSIKLVGMKGSYGTPTTLVLDPDGIVRWHGFNGSAKTVGEVKETLAKLLADYDSGADVVARRIAYAEKKRARGFPAEARQLLETGAKALAKAADAKKLQDKLAAWKNDAKFAKELDAEKTLMPLLNDAAAAAGAAKADASIDKLDKNLEKLAKSCVGSPVAERIERERERLKTLSKQ